MQAYSAEFARVYNLRWGGFAQRVAPLIRELYETYPISQVNRTVLDLCCGTGQLAALFLEAGYQVIGLDSSAPMLAYASENTSRFRAAGKIQFIHGDATDFTLTEQVGLVVSTFDALNHLESSDALKNCFLCVFAVLEAGGVFVFDLNTRVGLRRWNGIIIDDNSAELLMITRGIYDGEGDKAWTRITGFVQEENGLYSRFDETAFNTAFDLAWAKATLLDIGWTEVYLAGSQDMKTPLSEPEREGRVFFVARK
jgi:SAM-dependent methyltransferase